MMLSEVRRRSRFDRDLRERFLPEPVAFFESGEVLYSARYINPAYLSLIEGEI